VFLCRHCSFTVRLGNEPTANPESSGEDTSDSEDETATNGPSADEHVCYYYCSILWIDSFENQIFLSQRIIKPQYFDGVDRVHDEGHPHL